MILLEKATVEKNYATYLAEDTDTEETVLAATKDGDVVLFKKEDAIEKKMHVGDSFFQLATSTNSGGATADIKSFDQFVNIIDSYFVEYNFNKLYEAGNNIYLMDPIVLEPQSQMFVVKTKKYDEDQTAEPVPAVVGPAVDTGPCFVQVTTRYDESDGEKSIEMVFFGGITVLLSDQFSTATACSFARCYGALRGDDNTIYLYDPEQDIFGLPVYMGE